MFKKGLRISIYGYTQEHGQLDDIVRNAGPLTEERFDLYFRQIVEALVHEPGQTA